MANPDATESHIADPTGGADRAADRVPPAAGGIFAQPYRAASPVMVTLVALFVFETLAVATAMPTVARALDGLSLYALAFAGTLASSVVGMAVAGRSADRRGPQTPLWQGLAWFGLGLVVAGLAPTMAALILGRILQGYGGGLMSVALYVVVGRVYPPVLRARIFAAFAAAYVLPAVVGPLVSGLIVQYASWRWVFLSVPVVAAVAALMVLPALRGIGPLPARGTAADTGRWRNFWAVGAAAGVLLLHYAGHRHGAAVVPWLLLAVAAVAVCTRQLLPAGSLRAARGLPAVMALRGLASAAFFGTEVYLPLLLSRERDLSPALAGLVLTLGAVGWSGGSWCRGRMADPAPVRILQVGQGLIAVGVIVVTAAVWPAMPVALAMAGWLVAGLGMGLAFPTLSVLTLELSPPELQGIHSSALQLSGSLATAAVLALGGSLFTVLVGHAPMLAYLAGFAATAALAIAGVLLARRVQPA